MLKGKFSNSCIPARYQAQSANLLRAGKLFLQLLD
jgi:hypothetical protein